MGQSLMNGEKAILGPTEGKSWLNSIAINPLTKRIYLADAKTSELRSFGFFTVHEGQVIVGHGEHHVKHPFQIDLILESNTLIWTDWKAGGLFSGKLQDVGDHEPDHMLGSEHVFKVSENDRLLGVRVVAKNKQMFVKSNCLDKDVCKDQFCVTIPESVNCQVSNGQICFGTVDTCVE